MKRFGIAVPACALLLALLLCATALADVHAVPEDGVYTVSVDSSSDMFRVVKCVLRVQDGDMQATLTVSGQGYGYLYSGTASEADAAPTDTWVPFVLDDDGKKTFTIPISALDAGLNVAAWSIKYEKWYARVLNFKSNTLRPYVEPEPKPEAVFKAADGIYSVEVTTDSALLVITDATIKIKSGKITAVLTAEDSAYAYLYLGFAKNARTDENGWIPIQLNADGSASYVLQLPAIGVDIPIATYSEKRKMWYDRTLYLVGDTLVVAK